MRQIAITRAFVDELGRHRCVHEERPDHTAGEQIDDGGRIEPALRCPPHVALDVSDPFAVRRRRFEAAVEHVGSDGGDLPLTQIGRQSTPSRAAREPAGPHQTLDPMQSTRHAFRQQVRAHTRLAP